MASPELSALRNHPSWPGAVVYFQGLIAADGPKVPARIAAFHARYAGNPCASVIDAIISVQWRWEIRVAPALDQWMAMDPAPSLASLAANGPGPKVGRQTLRPNHGPAIQGVAAALLTFGHPNATDSDRFSVWASQATVLRYHHALDPVGEVKGVGTALFNYLLMRAGQDALKPDSRIKQHLVRAGFAGSTNSLSDLDALRLAECMAEEHDVTRLSFDKLLW